MLLNWLKLILWSRIWSILGIYPFKFFLIVFFCYSVTCEKNSTWLCCYIFNLVDVIFFTDFLSAIFLLILCLAGLSAIEIMILKPSTTIANLIISPLNVTFSVSRIWKLYYQMHEHVGALYLFDELTLYYYKIIYSPLIKLFSINSTFSAINTALQLYFDRC